MNDYRKYLCSLAADLDCEFRFTDHLHGMMYVEFGYVEGPEPYESQICFAVGLHELGHVHHGHTQGRPPMGHLRHYFDNGVLRSEAEAWEFALDHFDLRNETVEDETRSFMWNTCLNSYYSTALSASGSTCYLWNGDRHHIPFVYDEPTEFFWKIKGQILGEVSAAA